VKHRPGTILPWLGEQGWLTMAAALFVVAGVWGFVELADHVQEGNTQTFDERAIRMLRNPDDLADPIGPAWLEEAGRDLTGLGGVIVLVIMILGVLGYLLMIRKYHAVWLVLAATIGGQILSSTLKNTFDRQRPDLVPHLSKVHTSSFPSGHSMMSSVVYLTLGALLARLTARRAVKFYFIGIALLLTFLVGLSRVYMGVHYPTDVLAGWTAGLVWAILCWLVARYLQQRGAVESDNDVADNDFRPQDA
jgi:undecaprenyl-diphosphatase